MEMKLPLNKVIKGTVSLIFSSTCWYANFIYKDAMAFN